MRNFENVTSVGNATLSNQMEKIKANEISSLETLTPERVRELFIRAIDTRIQLREDLIRKLQNKIEEML